MNVIVTGGAGYIGSHICKALKQAGYTPITIDNLSGGHPWAVRWGPLIEENIQNKEALIPIFRKFTPVAVFHLASSINVRESILNPMKYYNNNTIATLKLIEAMVECKIPYMVFSSTASIFGTPQRVPIKENDAKCPLHAYGKSKWMVEMMLQDFEAAYGLLSCCLRYFNAAGADPDGEIGEAHNPETHLIPLVLKTALKEIPFFTLYGNDYNTPDGSAIRDFIHVSDLARAHVLSLQYMMEKKRSLALNLGSGKGYSVIEVIKACENLCGSAIPVNLAERSPDAERLIACSEAAEATLGWYKEHSDLNTILRTALLWHASSMKKKTQLISL